MSNPLDAIKARLAKATPGPWHETHPISSDFTKADFDLCLHAPTDLAKLIAEREVYVNALKDYADRQGYYAEPETAQEALAEGQRILEGSDD